MRKVIAAFALSILMLAAASSVSWGSATWESATWESATWEMFDAASEAWE